MNIAAAEIQFIECYNDDKAAFFDQVEFFSALDTLLGLLLSQEAGYPTRPTDGVLLEYEERNETMFFAAGVAVMIEDQRVEPVTFRFEFNSDACSIRSGHVTFGSEPHSIIPYGSSEHRRLVKSLLANPHEHRMWRHQFFRSMAGWSSVPNTSE
ncbi:MAG: hypothetical protein L0229_17845 [Blastocatellia bacterium]|nr:hypothetical protein [Blastocatellia bacterium]